MHELSVKVKMTYRAHHGSCLPTLYCIYRMVLVPRENSSENKSSQKFRDFVNSHGNLQFATENSMAIAVTVRLSSRAIQHGRRQYSIRLKKLHPTILEQE